MARFGITKSADSLILISFIDYILFQTSTLSFFLKVRDNNSINWTRLFYREWKFKQDFQGILIFCRKYTSLGRFCQGFGNFQNYYNFDFLFKKKNQFCSFETRNRALFW